MAERSESKSWDLKTPISPPLKFSSWRSIDLLGLVSILFGGADSFTQLPADPCCGSSWMCRHPHTTLCRSSSQFSLDVQATSPQTCCWSSVGRPGFELGRLRDSFPDTSLKALLFYYNSLALLFHHQVELQGVIWTISLPHTFHTLTWNFWRSQSCKVLEIERRSGFGTCPPRGFS